MENKIEKAVKISVNYSLTAAGCKATIEVRMNPDLFTSSLKILGERVGHAWGSQIDDGNNLKFRKWDIFTSNWEGLKQMVKDNIDDVKATLANICLMQAEIPAPSEETFYFI